MICYGVVYYIPGLKHYCLTDGKGVDVSGSLDDLRKYPNRRPHYLRKSRGDIRSPKILSSCFMDVYGPYPWSECK